jgi:predicted component of type VI protein secretion system
MPEETCHRLLTGDSHLDWKLGNAEEIDRIFRLGLPGLELRPVEQIPRALPARGEWLYYRINTESAAWHTIKVSQNIGVRLRDTLITNPDKLPGQRRVEVAFEGRKTTLEFAVFAVPT